MAPILFVWLCYSIYHQVSEQKQLPSFIASLQQIPWDTAFWYLLLITVLAAFNWGLEAYKWMRLTHSLEPLSFRSAYAAILTGQAVSFSSINRVGESIGKSMLLSDGNRLKGVVLSFVASASQLIVTLVAGLMATIYLFPAIHVELQDQLHVSELVFSMSYGALYVVVFIFIVCYAAIPFFANKLAKVSFFQSIFFY